MNSLRDLEVIVTFSIHNLLYLINYALDILGRMYKNYSTMKLFM